MITVEKANPNFLKTGGSGMANEYTPDLITLIGDDGKEIEFEILDIIENDGCASAGHSLCNSKTDSVRCAGYQSNLTFQGKISLVVHDSFSFSFMNFVPLKGAVKKHSL